MKQKIKFWLERLFFIIGIVFTLYIISTSIEIFQEPSQHYTTFYLGIMLLSALLMASNIIAEPNLTGLKFWIKLGFFGCVSILSIFLAIYLRYHAVRMTQVQPFFGQFDMVIGVLILVSLLIINWYFWGTLLTAMISLAISYVFWGHRLVLPFLCHDEFSASFCLSYMGLDTTSGIFWFVPLAADNIYLLIIFAALLIGIGMLPLVIELGKWMGQHVKGGAAFPAIVGSALTGTVMGQAVSNTMLTGQLTIPMMKKAGFTPDFAGAIECVASTSGQFLPPILGLAAFIIAAFLNIAYIEVAMAATLPALLFVGGVVIAVLLRAQAKGLGVWKEHVDYNLIMRLMPSFAGSFLTVLVLLLLYYSPSVAALSGIVVMIALSFFQGDRRPTLKTFGKSLKDGLEVVVPLCVLLLAIGPIAQMATVTNLAGKLSTLLSNTLPHNVLLILMGTMVISIFMGTGLPTPVAYLVVALTLVPFLQELGVIALTAHLFCFYFAVYSTISPPVAISCLAAAKLSGGSFFGTARESLRIALPGFLIPYIFVFNSDLLLFPRMSLMGLWAFILTLVVMFYFSVGLFGFLKMQLSWWERIFSYLCAYLGVWYLKNLSFVLLAAFIACCTIFSLWVFLFKKRYTVQGVVGSPLL